ncbi:MAG: vWA domain-containing protein [Blastocatellia bacterium]
MRHKQTARGLLKQQLLLTLIFFAALTATGWSQTSAATNNLTQVFQIDLPSADTAILMDASLSMRNHRYADVRQAVIEFASTGAGKETLSLRVFGDVPSSPLEGAADKLAGNVADHLPPEPMFHNTDLGMAIQKGLEFFERNGAGEVQVLFLLTDGQHQPPAGSPYTRDFANDPNWQALRRRAQELCRQRQVLVYGFGLGSQTDISLLLKIFPASNVEVVVGDAAQVATIFRRVRENLRFAQLRRAVEQELNTGGIEVRFAQSAVVSKVASITQPVTIRNRYRHLPVVLESINLQNTAGASREITCEMESLPRDLTLAPGEQWQGQLRATLRTETSNLRLGRVERSFRASVQLTPIARFPHEAEIARLNVGDAKPLYDARPLAIELRERHGVPYWLIATSSLAGLCFVLIARRGRKLRARRQAFIEQRHAERKRLSGALKIWPSHKAEPGEDGVDLSAHKTTKLDLAPGASGALEVASSDSDGAHVVAHLSGRLTGASPGKAESGRVEFRLEAARGHRLAYESDGEWREAAQVILCDRDVIEIDGSWRLRYANHRLRTRAEVESACGR